MKKEFKTYEFVSRQQTYSVVLQPGMPGNRSTGQPPIPGIHLRFSNGYAKINRPINGVDPEKLYEMAQMHPAYDRDFIDVTDGKNKKPFGENRALSEPEHEIMQMKHGSVVGVTQPKKKFNFNAQQQDAIKGMFAEMLNDMPASKLEEILEKKKGMENTGDAPSEENVNVNNIEEASSIGIVNSVEKVASVDPIPTSPQDFPTGDVKESVKTPPIQDMANGQDVGGEDNAPEAETTNDPSANTQQEENKDNAQN